MEGERPKVPVDEQAGPKPSLEGVDAAQVVATSLEEDGQELREQIAEALRSADVEGEIARLLQVARKTLAANEAQLAVIVRADEKEAIVLLDTLGLIKSVCTRSGALLGSDEAKLIGRPIDALLRGPQDVEDSTAEMERATLGESVTSQRSHTRSDGSRFLGEHHLVAVVGPLGEVTGFVRRIVDVTQRRVHEIRIEQLKASIAILIDPHDPESPAPQPRPH